MGVSFTKKMKLTICLLVFVSVYSSSDADVCDKNVCFKNLFSHLRHKHNGLVHISDVLTFEEKFWENLPLIQDLNVKDFIERLFSGEFGPTAKRLFIRSFLNPQELLFDVNFDYQKERMKEYLQPADSGGPMMTLASQFKYFEWDLLNSLYTAVRPNFVSVQDLQETKKTLRVLRNCYPDQNNSLIEFFEKNLDGLIETVNHLKASGVTSGNREQPWLYKDALSEVPWFNQTEKTIESLAFNETLFVLINNFLTKNQEDIEREISNFFKVFKTVNEIGTANDSARLDVYLHYVTYKITSEEKLQSDLQTIWNEDGLRYLEAALRYIATLTPEIIKRELEGDVTVLQKVKETFFHTAKFLEEMFPPPSCMNKDNLPENMLFGEKMSYGHYLLLRGLIPIAHIMKYMFYWF